jgi:multiple sugar transport system ATP-binding protein
LASIVLNQIVKEFGSDAPAVNGVDLEIGDGEFFVLVGPSGCGKTTLLRLIAGLEQPSSGSVMLGDDDVTEVAPRDRDIAMVFQNYALYPQMKVSENIGYGLRIRRLPKDEIRRRVEQVAEILGITELLDRRPGTLSGGQRQRVAMGRAIAREPRAYLMDEPLSNLDAKLRVSMRAELESLHQRLGVTTVYVTHDQVEAMTLGTRAAVMRAGVIQQVDTPQILYREPNNVFVAAFIGSPSMNFGVGRFEGGTLRLGSWAIPLPAGLRPAVGEGEPVLVGVRPEEIKEPQFAGTDAFEVNARVAVRDDLGHETLLYFPVEGLASDAETIRRLTFEREQAADALAGSDGRPFCARIGGGHGGGVGSEVPLSLAPEALRFFDLNSGDALARQSDRAGAAHAVAKN